MAAADAQGRPQHSVRIRVAPVEGQGGDRDNSSSRGKDSHSFSDSCRSGHPSATPLRAYACFSATTTLSFWSTDPWWGHSEDSRSSTATAVQQLQRSTDIQGHRLLGTQAVVPPILLRGLRGLPASKVRKLCLVEVDVWWPSHREQRVHPRFWMLPLLSAYWCQVQLALSPQLGCSSRSCSRSSDTPLL